MTRSHYILISSCCVADYPQTWWLTTTDIYRLTAAQECEGALTRGLSQADMQVAGVVVFSRLPQGRSAGLTQVAVAGLSS